MYKLEDSEALFLAYYYTFEFKGSYPFITVINGKLTEFPGEIFKHLIRNILGLKSVRVEMQIIDYLRTYSKSQIIRRATQEFEILKKRKNFADRILFVYNMLSSIRNGCMKAKSNMEVTNMDNQENVQGENQQEVKEATDTYESIEEYKAKTGRRFRLLKTEKEAGLSREEAFKQRFGLND